MQINDNIDVLDDNISGVIVRISGDQITISTEDGFEMEFDKSEIVVVDHRLAKDAFKHISARQILQEKEIPKKKKQHQIKIKGSC